MPGDVCGCHTGGSWHRGGGAGEAAPHTTAPGTASQRVTWPQVSQRHSGWE